MEKGKLSILDIPIYKNEKKDFIHAPNLIGKKLTVTFENGNNVTEATATVTAEPLSLEGKFLMYGFALIGGLILNFMPCVLPVVLLKVFSLTKHHGKSTRHIRKALFISVLGILASFMVLGLLPIIFGLLGGSFGWGMQFQEPVFVVFMMLVLAVFAANFWGWFEIILPDNITTLGYDYSDREGDMGHFLSGMFTTLLATPLFSTFFRHGADIRPFSRTSRNSSDLFLSWYWPFSPLTPRDGLSKNRVFPSKTRQMDADI